MYKLVISDLDGTLLNEKHVLSEYTKKAIEKLNEKGVPFFLATGRHFLDLFDLKRELNLPETYSISCNGARVHGPNGELLISHNIDDDIANEVLNIELDTEISHSVFTDDKIYVFDEKELEAYGERQHMPFEFVNKENFKVKKPIKWFYHCENHEKLVDLDIIIKDKWGAHVDTMFSMEECLEIMPKHVSKGYAIKEIAKLENINIDDIIAFGDGFNDLEMLSIVGKGCIMGNASEKLKRALPNNEIIGQNHEDAVAKYLEKLYL